MTANTIPRQSVSPIAAPKLRININRVNLFLDIFLLLAFSIELQFHFTGLRIHELLGLGFAVTLLVHLVLHWKWIVSVTVRFFRNLFHSSRLNYVLNVALLIDMAVITVTGIAISRTLGWNLTFGFAPFIARSLHTLSSNLALVIVGLHVALHWKWIVTNTRKYLLTVGSRVRNAGR